MSTILSQWVYPNSCSIVAVHGLNGDSIKTWTEPESKQLWLRDLLPQKLSRARIMTFGYNARPLLQNSVADIKDYAMDLLECLAEKRRREYVCLLYILHYVFAFYNVEMTATVEMKTLFIRLHIPFANELRSSNGS